jgi:hypothetical protein
MVQSQTECSAGSSDHDPRCDFGIHTTVLPAGSNQIGWLDIDTVFGIHSRTDLDPDYVQPLGLGFTSYEGLPVIPMVIQEHTNGNVGGVFGGVTPALWEVSYSSE